MAIAALRVPTIFTAVDRFSDVVTRMTAKTSAFGASAEAAAMRTSRSFNRAGTNMLTAGVGMAVGIGYAVNEAVKYEAALASLAAVTGTKVGVMNQQIESLGRETKRNVIDIAKSFEIVGSKMSQYLDNPEALKGITKASILMADASKMELEPAIESLTGVLNIFGKSASDANYIVNKLSAGEIVGSISIAETADVLRQFGGTARLANVQVDESIALIQTLTKSLGIEGVGRGIRNLMVDFNMVGVFDKNKTKALQKAGVDMDVLGNKSLDLVTRMRELKKLEGNSAAMGMFFKKTGIQTGATLFQNFDDYIRFLDLIKKTNAAQEQADKNNATMAKKMKDLKAQVSFLAITIGTALLPRIKNLADSILPVIESITEWAKRNRGFANTLMNIAKWLLILGVTAKVLSVLFYGVSKAIAFASVVMRGYTFVSTLAALSNVSLGRAIVNMGIAMGGAIGSFLAAAGPILAVVGILGGLIYMLNKSGETVGNFGNQNALHLKLVTGNYETMEERIAASNARIVANMKKFKMDLKSVEKTGKTIAELEAGRIAKTISFAKAKLITDNTTKTAASTKVAQQRLFVSPRAINDTDAAFNEIMATGRYKNLAGNKTANSNENGAMGGTLKLEITTPQGTSANVDSKDIKGIKIILKENQGQR